MRSNLSPKWYLDLPIQRKLLLWFAPLLLVTIAITGVYSYNIASNEIVSKMSLEQASSARQAIDHLDYIAQDALDISDYLYLTPEIQVMLKSDPASDSYINNDSILMINRLMVTRPYFQFLTIYSPHFEPIQFNNKGLSSAIPFEEFKEKFDYEGFLKRKKIDEWSIEVPNHSKSIFYGDTKNKLLLTKILKNDLTLKPEGVLILGIDEKDIRRSYAMPSDKTTIIVINSDGRILSDTNGNWIGKLVGELPYFTKPIDLPDQIESTIERSDWVFSHTQSTLTGWHVLVLQPREDLLSQLNRIKWITALILCLTFVMSLIVSWSVASVITKPMKMILSSMKKFQKGDFSQQVSIEGKDEIGQLGTGYNVMVRRISQLIDDVYAFEIKQRQAELKLLQSQINPHFLYNTLNTIAWTAQKNGEHTVAEMIYSLSGIFQISLSQGRDYIELQEEMKLAEHYLFLQKMRYREKLSYELELHPDFATYKIPKLLIQPLIENAIVHGLEPLTDDIGFIQVTIVPSANQPNMIQIEITDNGVGIPANKLKLVQEQIFADVQHQTTGSEGFALQNIMNRIRLFYGADAIMEISSIENFGTRVQLLLPYSKR
ncbi:sensor histidine kinase [Paenibacillus frigoriresistens]|uniref:cache domain-containing sensor histidine kinase n=1 Tax=Paenibacillus alginolyticus TaxID=59839 RepID=UPI001566F51A|nr:sensor histidine kinase [Paenibacillus frigoriresistens]NRF93375.1 sensor histidine kinase [Paenibacillus frigoriresistens]